MYPQEQLVVASVLISAVGYWLFHKNRDAAFKRRWWPWFIIMGDLLVLGIVWRMHLPMPVYGIMIPSVLAVTMANLRNVKFCNACGRTILMKSTSSGQIAYCPYCGTRLID